MDTLKLILLPCLTAKKISELEIVITRKFLDGVKEYTKYWKGEIEVVLEEDLSLSDNLDNITVNVNSLPFQLRILNYQSPAFLQMLEPGMIVLAAVNYRLNELSYHCKLAGVPCVYISECSLKTRFQMIHSSFRNPVIRARKYLWETLQERKQIKAIRRADGIQCNGTPTFNSYHKINPDPLLFFDSRIDTNMLITEHELAQRTQACLTGAKLRLLFSGRLLKMKGADQLIMTAMQLRKLGVNFAMYICGDGELSSDMKKMIGKNGLKEYVIMKGVLEFKEELLPFVKNQIDLFVCCHIQGDPSCTYLETLSCGVPIVGYANEAFVGVIEASSAGWATKMNRPDLLAIKIAELDSNRELLVQHSKKSLSFAALHTFEKTFQNRISHLHNIAQHSAHSASQENP